MGGDAEGEGMGDDASIGMGDVVDEGDYVRGFRVGFCRGRGRPLAATEEEVGRPGVGEISGAAGRRAEVNVEIRAG